MILIMILPSKSEINLFIPNNNRYVQLHRDTTVTTLVMSPSMQDGRVVWEDSPLVRAMEHGRIFVLDEFDKAPVEVVVVLKGLLEDGELLLGDGRRFVSPKSPLWTAAGAAGVAGAAGGAGVAGGGVGGVGGGGVEVGVGVIATYYYYLLQGCRRDPQVSPPRESARQLGGHRRANPSPNPNPSPSPSANPNSNPDPNPDPDPNPNPNQVETAALAPRLTVRQLLLIDGLNRDHLYLAQGE